MASALCTGLRKASRGLVILSIENGQITPLTQAASTITSLHGRHAGISLLSRAIVEAIMTSTHQADGTGLRRLTNSSGNDAHCVWSPNGEWIIFSSSRMGFQRRGRTGLPNSAAVCELFVMRSDGTDVRQLTDNQWEDATPAWMPESTKR